MPSPKLIILAGAPELRDVKAEDLTVRYWLPPFAKFLSLPGTIEVEDVSDDITSDSWSASAYLPAWRAVQLEQADLHTGWSQRGWLDDTFARPEGEQPRPVGAELASDYPETVDALVHQRVAPPSDIVTQFIEHSYTLHEDTRSAQITGANEIRTPYTGRRRRHAALSLESQLHAYDSDIVDTTASSVFLSNSPTTTASLGFETPNRYTIWTEDPATPTIFSAPHLHDLSGLPAAAYISSIEPQTITVDLIVGIISLAAARTVTIRRTGGQIDLIEMLVGDETRAGFGITFWVAPSSAGAINAGLVADPLRQSLEKLRPGDVILLRNVALSHFRRVVYGQSLKRVARGWETAVSLQHRSGSSKSTAFGGYDPETGFGLDRAPAPVFAKIRRVVDWTRQFVKLGGAGAVANRGVKRRREVELRDELPLDDTP